MMSRTLLTVAMALLGAGGARAGIIFSNLDGSPPYDVTEGNPVGNGFTGDNFAEGESFTPAATAVFSSLSVALSCVAGCPAAENFALSLRNDGGDEPGAIIESFIFTGRSLNALGLNDPLVTVTSVLRPTLTSGLTYWITVTSSVAFSIAWNLTSTGDANDQAISQDGGASWFSPSGLTPGAFEVDSPTAPVPEPATTLGIAGAVLGLILAKSRRSRTDKRLQGQY